MTESAGSVAAAAGCSGDQLLGRRGGAAVRPRPPAVHMLRVSGAEPWGLIHTSAARSTPPPAALLPSSPRSGLGRTDISRADFLPGVMNMINIPAGIISNAIYI